MPKAVAAAVERVDLGPKAKARLRTLSGGMLRRVGIAQAIVNDPELLLLDEPTAGLDPEQRVAFRTLIRDLGQRATVVVSTHLVEDVGAACSEVALMAEGKVVFRGTPDELTAHGEGHERRRLPAGARLQRGPRGVPQAGGRVTAVALGPRARPGSARPVAAGRRCWLEIKHSAVRLGAAAAGRAVLRQRVPDGGGVPADLDGARLGHHRANAGRSSA